MKRILSGIFVFILGVVLSIFWLKTMPKISLNSDPLMNAEKITGISIPNRFKVSSYYYQNTGDIQLNSHGEKFYGFIEISNPTDRYDFREFAKKHNYISLPYIGKDSVLLHLKYNCTNKLSFNGRIMSKGYYKIETTDRERKIALFDEVCGVLFFYYELKPL
jgi:hypothetical protein